MQHCYHDKAYTDRQTDRQTKRQAGRQADKQAGRHFIDRVQRQRLDKASRVQITTCNGRFLPVFIGSRSMGTSGRALPLPGPSLEGRAALWPLPFGPSPPTLLSPDLEDSLSNPPLTSSGLSNLLLACSDPPLLSVDSAAALFRLKRCEVRPWGAFGPATAPFCPALPESLEDVSLEGSSDGPASLARSCDLCLLIFPLACLGSALLLAFLSLRACSRCCLSSSRDEFFSV